MNLQVT